MSHPNRRTVLSAAGLAAAGGALAGCTPAPEAPAPPAPAPDSSPPAAPPAPSPSSTVPSSSSPAPTAGSVPSGPSVPVSQVPVGGGVIIETAFFLVTQPTAGTFRAFDKRCTHAGCPVAEIADGGIDCLCHGSRFSIVDGSVVRGPATEPLRPATATVAGDVVVVSSA